MEAFVPPHDPLLVRIFLILYTNLTSCIQLVNNNLNKALLFIKYCEF
ncbi:hypothetical protein ANABIO32_08870 [Rossellomorea marisflavi]|nr:hypothetical protein ANABIO32_08870 [Rossellomorea marisflavi]